MQDGDNVIEIHKNESKMEEGSEEEIQKKDTEEGSEQNETQNRDDVEEKIVAKLK